MKLGFFLIGFGDVGSNKLFPRLVRCLENTINSGEMYRFNSADVWVADLKPLYQVKNKIESFKPSVNVLYHQIRDDDDRQKLKKISEKYDRSIVYIASPNETHITYLKLFLDTVDEIYVEKPLVEKLRELNDLKESFSGRDLGKVRMIDHYIFKDVVQYLINNFDKLVLEIGELKRINFYLLEKKPIRGDRSWIYETGIVRDLLPHFLSIIFKVYERHPDGLKVFPINVKKVIKGIYKANETLEIRGKIKETFGVIDFNLSGIRSRVILGKGVGFDLKKFTISGEGRLTVVIDFIENSLMAVENFNFKTLYKKIVEKYHEYDKISCSIVTKVKDIGLPFSLASRQVDLFEKIDDYPIEIIYGLGENPLNQLELT